MTRNVSVDSDIGRGRWTYQLERFLPDITMTPDRITLLYLVFGFAALYLSDVVFVQTFSDPPLRRIQALKGGAEVLLTGGFIFLLSRLGQGQLKAQNEHLERTQHELQLLHRVFRHNLRNDLNVIQGYAEMLQDDLSDDTRRRYHRRVSETAAKIMEYTEQAQRIRRVADHDSSATFDLGELLSRILEEEPAIDNSVTVDTSIPETVEVRANPQFEDAIREVLRNAVIHNDTEQPEIGIDVEDTETHRGGVTIRIRDNGPGIPDTEVTSLTGDSDSQVLHSTGMGLWFVRWVVTHSGGTLDIVTSDTAGTEVTIKMPRA